MAFDIRQRRRLWNMVHLSISVLMTALALFFLGWLLWTLFARGLARFDWALFVHDTPGPGDEAGGMRNAIVGSLLLTAFGVLMGAPLGVLTGTYLAEFGRHHWLAKGIRFVNDVLLSAPSIVIGVFVYELMVVGMGHFSGWAGAVALAIIVVPVVVRTSEDMMRLVPDAMREAAAALGAPQWKIVVTIVWKAAVSGIATGILLAVARIAGETAPLLFTALNNQFFSLDMNQPIANLPVMIFNFAMGPYENWHGLAWAASLLITLAVLGLNILARLALGSRRGRS
ncbi:MAG: phosphate ABC transporter permease PstA [Alphaproteobacteria bacterium]|nr:MAG: phosphate ABC transporter permease PstA [Alphaproteobacteria bacterium]